MGSFSEFRRIKIQEIREIKDKTTEAGQIDGFERILELIGVPYFMIEIGSHLGYSTEFWLLNCPQVIAVDPWAESYGGIDNPFGQFMDRCGAYPNLTICREKSPEALYKLPKVDFIYIDGDHFEHAVRHDIEAALWTTKRPGWIGGHDYDHYGVKRAVDDYAVNLPLRLFEGKSWLLELK